MSTAEASPLRVESQGETTPGPGKKAIIFLIAVSFLNTMGMTIIGPVVPFMTLRYLNNPNDLALVVAWMTSSYGICQLLAAPGLGLLSDRYGRRPVLFLCLIGSAVGYLLFGFGGALWALFLGRIIDGLTGGNFSVLFAYLADVTKPEERGKYFGIAGGFSGVGFILGPSIGGLLASINYSIPFLVAATIILLTTIWGFFFLPESLQKEHRTTSLRWQDLNPLKQLIGVFRIDNLRWLLLAGLFYALPFACLIANLTVFLRDSLGWNATQAGLLSTVVGVVDIVAQGVLVGKLLKIFGDVKLGIGALVLVAISYIVVGMVALFAVPIVLVVGIILFAGAGGLAENALKSLTSRAVGRRQQGVVAGANQSMMSLATIVGPLIGGFAYVQLGHAIPYWSGAVIVLLAIGAIVLAIPALGMRASAGEQ